MYQLRILYAISAALIGWLLVWGMLEINNYHKRSSDPYSPHHHHETIPAPASRHHRPPHPIHRAPVTSPIPPPDSPVFANHVKSYPPTDPLYPDEEIGTNLPRLRHLLAHWVHLTTTQDLRYVLIAGSLLGALRNSHIIPWDGDMDVAVDRESAEKIAALALGNFTAGWPGGSKLDGVSIQWNSAVIDHQPWEDNDVRLIVNFHRAQNQPDDSVRYDQTGKAVDSQVDSVSFCGPFARLITRSKGRMSHLDVYCVAEFDGWMGDTEEGPERASFPARVEPCSLEGYPLWCPSKEDYQPVLEHDYGKDFLVPRH